MNVCVCTYTDTYSHTHPYIYIYISGKRATYSYYSSISLLGRDFRSGHSPALDLRRPVALHRL